MGLKQAENQQVRTGSWDEEVPEAKLSEVPVHEATWVPACAPAGITSFSFSVSLSEQIHMCYVRKQTSQVVPMSAKDNE